LFKGNEAEYIGRKERGGGGERKEREERGKGVGVLCAVVDAHFCLFMGTTLTKT
jgi:hypothetical protein